MLLDKDLKEKNTWNKAYNTLYQRGMEPAWRRGMELLSSISFL